MARKLSRKKSVAEAARRFLASKSESEASRLLGRRTLPGTKQPAKRWLTASNRWEKWEIRLLGKHTDLEVARQIGRSYDAVQVKRLILRIPIFEPKHPPWSRQDDLLLGTMRDEALAQKLGRTRLAVSGRRQFFGLPPFAPRSRPWTSTDDALLCKYSDAELASRLHRTP